MDAEEDSWRPEEEEGWRSVVLQLLPSLPCSPSTAPPSQLPGGSEVAVGV